MDPFFTIGIVTKTDLLAIGVQVFSALCVLGAAIYAGRFPIRKNNIDQLNKMIYILGRTRTIAKKLRFIANNIVDIYKLEEVSDLLLNIQILRNTCLVFKLEDDVDFLVSNEEVITAHPAGLMNVSEVVFEFQLFLFTLHKDLALEEVWYLKNYLADLSDRATKQYDIFEKVVEHLGIIVESYKVNSKIMKKLKKESEIGRSAKK